MSEQVPELGIYLSLLPVGPIIEGDLFTMIDQVVVLGSVLALELSPSLIFLLLELRVFGRNVLGISWPSLRLSDWWLKYELTENR